MRRYICNHLYTSPLTGKTYLAGQVIPKYEYDGLSYSEAKQFTEVMPNQPHEVNLGV